MIYWWERKKFQRAANYYSWFYNPNYNGHYAFSVNVKCVFAWRATRPSHPDVDLHRLCALWIIAADPDLPPSCFWRWRMQSESLKFQKFSLRTGLPVRGEVTSVWIRLQRWVSRVRESIWRARRKHEHLHYGVRRGDYSVLEVWVAFVMGQIHLRCCGLV